jgi:hypothetical protein
MTNQSQLPDKKRLAPERIWLCPQNYEAATSCCHPSDTEYVRADLLQQPTSERCVDNDGDLLRCYNCTTTESATSPANVAEGERCVCGHHHNRHRWADRDAAEPCHDCGCDDFRESITAPTAPAAPQDCIGCIASKAGVGRCLVHESKPSTATSEAAIEAARAAALEICDWCGIDQNDSERVAAIISKHIPDAGEVERLRTENQRLSRDRTKWAHNALIQARANAIREAIEVAGNLKAVWRTSGRVDSMVAADLIMTALQSLLEQPDAAEKGKVKR